MKTIAICNHKGGVGKTAIAVAFAECLNAKGFRTLLVDLDQQTNATTQAGAQMEGRVTVYDLLTNMDYSASEAIQAYDHGDIIPGDICMTDVEARMLTTLDTPLLMLSDALESVAADYDYCIIDCPPALGIVTRNAIVASDELIVVIKPEDASLDGFSKIVEVANKVRENRHLNPGLSIAGVLVNTYQQRFLIDQAIDMKAPELAEQARTKVFNTRIRACDSVRKAQSTHVSLWDFDPECNAAKDIQAFADEYLDGKAA